MTETPSPSLQDALTAVRSAPKDPRAWLHLGNVLAQEGDKAKAKDCYERALALDPLLSEAHQGLDALSQPPPTSALPAFLQEIETPVEPSITIEHPVQPPRLTAKRSLLTNRRVEPEPQPQAALPPPPPVEVPSTSDRILSALKALLRGLQRLVVWWWGKVRTAPSVPFAALWFFGGLCSFCMVCTTLYSATPMGQAAVAASNATSTARVIAASTAEAIAAATRTAEEQAAAATEVVRQQQEATAEAVRAQEEATAQVIALATSAEATRVAPPPSATPDSAATISAAQSATPEPTATSSVPIVTVQNAQLNARSGPGTDYPVLVTLKQGDTMPALGISADRNWVQVVLPDGQKGWVSSGEQFVAVSLPDALTISTDFAALPTAAPPPPAAGGGASGGGTGVRCDPSYPDVCIAPYPPDLNCLDVKPLRNFRVLPPDPHGLDGNDHDGFGCENN